jgi:hypothetical protein
LVRFMVPELVAFLARGRAESVKLK